MSNGINFCVGLSLNIIPASPQGVKAYTTRVIQVTDHTISISMPYDTGRLVLWPVGTRLEVNVNDSDSHYTFISEIIDRQLGDIKAYTIMLPHSISRSGGRRIHQTGMSRVIAITSGKGGVGKTTFTINLAIALSSFGQRVYIMDADLGTANVDVLLRLSPQYNILHLLTGQKSLIDIVVPGPNNIGVIPGGSGLQELTNIGERQFAQIVNSFNQLDGLADIILLDTGAGISRSVSNFILAADEVVIVTTPEPHAITDAYAITKVMQSLQCTAKKMLVVNRVEDKQEGTIISNRFITVISQYLKTDVDYLGCVVDDRLVSRSLKEQNPLLLSYPNSLPAHDIKEIAAKLLNKPIAKPSGLGGFATKLLNLFRK